MSLARALIALAVIAALFMGPSACAKSDAKTGSGPESQATLLVSAAASLSFVLPELAEGFEASTGMSFVANVASTGQLAQQIEQGAPVDLFLSADSDHVDQLEAGGLLLPDSRAVYARGRLVLWSHASEGDEPPALKALGGQKAGRLAIANPRHAPYGVAARDTLRSMGLWEATEERRVLAENVRQALQFAETGDVELAMVPLPLARRTAGRFPETHESPYGQVEVTRHV